MNNKSNKLLLKNLKGLEENKMYELVSGHTKKGMVHLLVKVEGEKES